MGDLFAFHFGLVFVGLLLICRIDGLRMSLRKHLSSRTE